MRQIKIYLIIFFNYFYLFLGFMKLLLRKVEAVNSESPLENGLSSKEEEDDLDHNVRQLAAKVVDDVVKKASEAAQRKTEDQSSPKKNRACNIQRLPTIQIDTVASPPPSPDELTPLDETNEIEEPVDESDIQLDLEQESDNSTEDLKERVKSYVEEIISEAMVVAEKRIQFAGLPEEDEEEDEEQECEPIQSCSGANEEEKEEEIDESEIRATAEKVVQEVITKASETAAEKLENEVPGLRFPGLPSIQIDKPVPSPPPSPDEEEESIQLQKKKWTFKVAEDSDSEKNVQTEKTALIKFDEAPEDVKEVATSFVKDIVGKAIAMAEEKSVPTVPFNFEDVDLMKTSGPWYIRAREALIRLLRTACFCTPRRTDS